MISKQIKKNCPHYFKQSDVEDLQNYKLVTISCQLCHLSFELGDYEAYIESLVVPAPLQRPAPFLTPPESILLEAHKLIHGEKRLEYGSAVESFDRVAQYWSIRLKGKLTTPLSSIDVASMMQLFKIARQQNKHKRDNLADLAGYTDLENQLYEHNEHNTEF